MCAEIEFGAIQWETSVAVINQFGCRQKPIRHLYKKQKGQCESEKKFDYTGLCVCFFDLFVQNVCVIGCDS